MMDIRLAKFFRIISIVMMQSVCENEIVYVFVEVEMQNLIKIVMMLSVLEIIETAIQDLISILLLSPAFEIKTAEILLQLCRCNQCLKLKWLIYF